MIHGYRLHQMQGNQIYGFRKSGYLLKKSEGKMRVKAWRKRRCEITDGFLFIYHSDETQPPTKLNLLTCQVKLVPGKEKKCFDLISFNRTYHFQVEDEHDITAWVYVLINCKEGALQKQFDDPNSNNPNHQIDSNNSSSGKDIVDFANSDPTKTNNSTSNSSAFNNQQPQSEEIQRLNAERRLQQQLIRQVQALNGNERCVDCSTTKDKPTWLSTNLGVLVCIECSGIHRDLGVHISRIQSLTLDNVNTSQLLIAHNMGNEFFNDIFESKLRQLESLAADIASNDFITPKLKPNSTMEQRCEFIKAKYLQKKFCQNIHRDDLERAKCLKEAVIFKDLRKLVQLYGEGFDIASCISNLEDTYEGLDLHDCRNPFQINHHHHHQHNQNLQQYYHHHHHHHHHYHHYNNYQNQQHDYGYNFNQHQQLQHQPVSDGQKHNRSIVANAFQPLPPASSVASAATATNALNSSITSNTLSQHNSMDDSIDAEAFHYPRPIINDQDTSIHLALSCLAYARDNAGVQFECDLFILDFIIQNSRAINKQNAYGETPLHYCAKYNLPDSMKLILRSGADKELKNNQGNTPLEVVETLRPIGFETLIEILGGYANSGGSISATVGGGMSLVSGGALTAKTASSNHQKLPQQAALAAPSLPHIRH